MKIKNTKRLETAAFQELEAAIRAYKENPTLPNLLKVANCYHNVGDLFNSIQCPTMAIDYYKQGRDTKLIVGGDCPTDKLLMSIADSSHAIGRAYYMLEEYDKAIWYNEKALLIIDKVSKITDTNAAAANIATIHYDIGKLYFIIKNYDGAIESFNSALLHKQFVLADEPLFQQSIRLDISKICNALGNSYHNKGDLNTARGFFIKSRDYKLPVVNQQPDEIKEQEVGQELLAKLTASLEEMGIGLTGDTEY